MAVSLRAEVEVQIIEEDTHALYVDGVRREAVDEELFAELIRLFAPLESLAFRVNTQIPRASGLGGSSALLVAAAAAMRAMDRRDFDASAAFDLSLLEVVNILEHRLLGKPAGTQDGLAAIHGSLSQIELLSGAPKHSEMPVPGFLLEPIFLLYAPIEHHSGLNNWEVVKRACEGDLVTMKVLSELGENALRVRDALLDGDQLAFREMIQLEAELRESLCESIMPDVCREFLDAFEGAVIGKMCGAGGGGCMYLLPGDDVSVAAMREEAEKRNLTLLQVEQDRKGLLLEHGSED